MSPTKLAAWNDLKPEGLGLSGSGQLTVFFDTGDDPPQFTTLDR
jgi:hypothetical protein